MKKSVLIRVDPVFRQEIDDIKIERLKKERDRGIKSDRRITKAIRRLSYWKKIKDDIINAEFENDTQE